MKLWVGNVSTPVSSQEGLPPPTLSGQRLPLDRDPSGQRPSLDRDPPRQRLSGHKPLDRNSLGQGPLAETPGQRPPLDRDLPFGQRPPRIEVPWTETSPPPRRNLVTATEAGGTHPT